MRAEELAAEGPVGGSDALAIVAGDDPDDAGLGSDDLIVAGSRAHRLFAWRPDRDNLDLRDLHDGDSTPTIHEHGRGWGASQEDGAVLRVTRDHTQVVFDRRIRPVASVKPGELFVVETDDSRAGRTRTPETTTPAFLLAMREKGFYGNPVTGPIFVEGTEPGDTLAVHIHEQECDSLGHMGYWPFLFHLDDLFDEPSTVLVEIRDGFVRFNERIQIPVRPMIGTIGTAPEVEAILSGSMGRHGGNIDAPEVCPGSTIYLPVSVEGALLALGDCHAVQSDGEIGSVEIRSVVTMSCEVIKGRSPVMTWPRIETPEMLVAVAVGRPLEEALWAALRDLILWLEERTGMSKHEAYLLIGAAGHARPGQAQVGLYSMRCMVPQEYLPETGAHRG